MFDPNLSLQVSEEQHKMTSHLSRHFTKRALIGEERSPQQWNRDLWVDSDEYEKLEPPSSSAPPSLLESSVLLPSEETNLPL